MGSQASAQDLLASAASKSRTASAVRFDLTIRLDTGSPSSFRMSGNGETVEHGRITAGRFVLRTGAGAPRRVPMDMILGDKESYFRYLSPDLASLMPRGKTWILVPPSKLGQTPDLGQNDPAQMVSYLNATSDVKRVGTDSVRGVTTSHFAGAIVIAKVLKRLAASGQANANPAMFNALAAFGVKQIPIDAWIDRHNLLRRIRVNWSLTNPQNSAEKLRLYMVADFYDYGAKLSVHMPQASQTISLKQFEKSAAGG
jgi:hypothetical protein